MDRETLRLYLYSIDLRVVDVVRGRSSWPWLSFAYLYSIDLRVVDLVRGRSSWPWLSFALPIVKQIDKPTNK